ncbi:MAG: MFS transporter, partial [Desulfobacteraceae bacterium]|nr:MFS transporter [Desulfobacteraceae bacterium]
PVFVTLLLLLIRGGNWVKRIFSPGGIFLTGLGFFAAGNIVSGLSSSPALFFVGRILQAVGGSMAYLGQLWTAMVWFKDRLVTVLFWGECGLAIGIISGPMLGGYLVDWGESGWRDIFFINAAMAILIVFLAGFHAIRKAGDSDAVGTDTATARNWREAYLLLGLQCAVMAAAVGGEYLLSTELQLHRGFSAGFVGWVTAAASVGAVAGSGMVASRPAHSGYWLRLGWGIITGGLPALGLFLTWLPGAWDALVLFFLGMGMGMASVSIYARIAEVIPAGDFVRVSILYLLSQQLGNALGVQIEEIVSQFNTNPLVPAIILAAPLVLFVIPMGNRKKGTEIDANTVTSA